MHTATLRNDEKLYADVYLWLDCKVFEDTAVSVHVVCRTKL